MTIVYISSTFEDLKDHRDAVCKALRRISIDVTGMEDYCATDERPLAKCLADVRRADIYVGIIAWRYGFVPDGEVRSITELEYRAALDAGIPTLMFVVDEEHVWSPRFIDRGESAMQLEEFRAHATNNHLCDSFSDQQELAMQVATAVSQKLVSSEGSSSSAGQPSSAALDPTTLSSYLQRFAQRFQRLDLDALTPPQREEYLQIALQDVFVEQAVRENAPPIELPKELQQRLLQSEEIREEDLPEGFDLEQIKAAREAFMDRPALPVFDILKTRKSGRLVLLGDPGAGKSTLLRYVALSARTTADERLAEFTDAVPILIELRAYAALADKGSCESFVDYIDYMARTENLGIPKDLLVDYLSAGGPAIVMFDGLDEIFDPERREIVARQIAGFAGSYPDVAVVVTSRIIGYRRKCLTDAEFEHFTLQDLTGDQITTFLSAWYELALHDRPADAIARRERLEEAIAEHSAIHELAGNPLLLTILAIIGKHQELPRERWRVYDHAATVLVEHWDVNRHLKSKNLDVDFISEDDKKELLRRVAFRMQAGDRGLSGNHILDTDLEDEFKRYIEERYRSDPASAAAVARAMIAQFRERNFILSRYGAGIHGFVHRAFLEHFCADTFVLRFEKRQELTIEQLRVDVYGRHWDDPSWREVLRLIAGRIDASFAGEILAYLTREIGRPWPQEFDNAPPVNLALAAQCLSEVRNVHALEAEAADLLAAVIALLEHGVLVRTSDPGKVLSGALLSVIEVIGPSWPERERYFDWYRRRGQQIAWTPVSQIAADILVRLFPSDDRVVNLLTAADSTDDRRKTEARLKAATWLLSRPSMSEEERDALLTKLIEQADDGGSAPMFPPALEGSRELERACIRLVRDAESETVRVVCLRVLSKRQNASVREALVDALESTNLRIQAVARESLRTHLGSSHTQDLLYERWAEGRLPLRRIGSLLTFDEPRESLIEAIAEWLWSPEADGSERDAMIRQLVRAKDQRARDLILRVLTDHPDVGVRSSAAFGFRPGDGRELEVARAVFAAGEPQAQASIAQVGPRLASSKREFLKRVAELAMSSSPPVSLQALRALEPYVDDRRALSVALVRARDENREVAEAAAMALASVSEVEEDVRDAMADWMVESGVLFGGAYDRVLPRILRADGPWRNSALQLLTAAVGRRQGREISSGTMLQLRRLCAGRWSLSELRESGLLPRHVRLSAEHAGILHLLSRGKAELGELERVAMSRRSAVEVRTTALRLRAESPATQELIDMILVLIKDRREPDPLRAGAARTLCQWAVDIPDLRRRLYGLLGRKRERPVHAAVIRGLEAFWPDLDPRLEGLRALASTSSVADARLAALWVLGRWWAPSTERGAFLQKVAANDSSALVRQAAIQAFTSGGWCDPRDWPSIAPGDGIYWTSDAYGRSGPGVVWPG